MGVMIPANILGKKHQVQTGNELVEKAIGSEAL
jgi:hypothetical protein